MITHLSSSQINLYLLCGKKYQFQYIDKIPKTFKSSSLAFGSVLHSALSWYHEEKLKSNGNGKDIPLDMILKIFEADWYSQTVEADIRYKEGEQELKLVMLGKEMLEMYLQYPQGKVKGAEVPFTVPLYGLNTRSSSGIGLEGFFDLIEEEDAIVEFKTSAQNMNSEDVDNHLQLTAYSYAYEQLYGRLPKTLKIINFVKTKKPKLNVFETQRTKEDHKWFLNLTRDVFKSICNESFLPRPGFMCKECEYQALCPMWNH